VSQRRPHAPTTDAPTLDLAMLDFPTLDFPTLDPRDWDGFRSQAHQMLDDILDYTQNLRKRPVWQPIPNDVRERFLGGVPLAPTDLVDVHREFMNYILPFAVGNAHPGFMGWVHGGGTPVGMLAEMLAAGLNANLGGRDQIPVEVERQIALWMRDVFGFPGTSAGLFVTGTSMANFIAVTIARDAALGCAVRQNGVAAISKRLTAYGSAGIHGCVGKAMDLCGLGSDALRRVLADDRRRIDLTALENAIRKDREAGLEPFLLVGTAGSVDTGAIDDLAALAGLAAREGLWFHVDGAYGALAMLAPDLAPKLKGIERADSLAFDFHKWGQVPYDAGFILVRDGDLQRNAFAASSSYLRRETRGMAAGSHWPCDYGPDLSRGFRALKTWFTLKVYGTEALGSSISRTCELARHLQRRIENTPELELLAPVELNIVCFRYRAKDADRVNAEIVVALQESGRVAPSTTTIDGKLAIRAAIVNHRTAQADIDKLVDQTLALGRSKRQSNEAAGEIRQAGVQGAAAAAEDAAAAAGVETAPGLRWEAELKEIEKALEKDPESVDLHFRRGLLLARLGQVIGAAKAYMSVLERDPTHLAALNNMGSVLIAGNHRKAALTAFKQAMKEHPNDAVSRVNAGRLLLEEAEQKEAASQPEEALQLRHEAREYFEQALLLRPGFENAHEGLCYVWGHFGDAKQADWHRREAFKNRVLMPLPFSGRRDPVRVLKLVSTTGGNVKLSRFLDPRIFQTTILLPEFFDTTAALPPHQLVVNAIGEESGPGALDAARRVLSLTGAPVINAPAAVLATSRDNNAIRLAGLPGVVTAKTARVPRERLSGADAAATLAELGFEFPLLLRAPRFHTGLHFLRAQSPEDLSAALHQLPGEELIVMQYLDARGADGKSRKYRAMMIDGQIYPLHCAISSNWKIHYFTAEMADNAEHRAEDAAFLENMSDAIGPLAMQALERIQHTLGLDYAGIDFGLNAKGEVLVFEANATMVVNPPEPDERWAYRRPACQRIHTAVQQMLIQRAFAPLAKRASAT
ncbi:MAG: pyridoxal-dependent decarboxylase, partial [Terriglobales bacterium]